MKTAPDFGLFVTSRKPHIKSLTITNYKGVKSSVAIILIPLLYSSEKVFGISSFDLGCNSHE